MLTDTFLCLSYFCDITETPHDIFLKFGPSIDFATRICFGGRRSKTKVTMLMRMRHNPVKIVLADIHVNSNFTS